jgi:hypothetical protein
MDSDYLRQMSIKNAKDAMKQAQTMDNRNNMITIKNIKETLEGLAITNYFSIKTIAELSGNATSPKYIIVLEYRTYQFEIWVERKPNRDGLYEMYINGHVLPAGLIMSTYISKIAVRDKTTFFSAVKTLAEEYELLVMKK